MNTSISRRVSKYVLINFKMKASLEIFYSEFILFSSVFSSYRLLWSHLVSSEFLLRFKTGFILMKQLYK